MKIEEISQELKNISEIGDSYVLRSHGVVETVYNKTLVHSMFLGDFLKAFFERYSINKTGKILRKLEKFLADKDVKYKSYEEYYEKSYKYSQRLTFDDLALVLSQEFLDRGSAVQNEKKETYQKDMREIKNFFLVNNNYFNDLFCFLGGKMFPNHEKPQNGYELLPGSLRQYFFSNFIFTNDDLKKDLQINYEDKLRR